MKRRRFVSLVCSMLLIMSMVVCIAVPAFAAEVYSLPYPDDFPEFIFPYDPSEYVYFFGRNSYIVGTGEFNNVPVVHYASSDVIVNYVSSMNGFRPVSGTVHGYWYNGTEWRPLNDTGPQGTFTFNPFISATVDIYDLEGNLYWSVPDPPKPPLVAATEGANLGAVMTQVIAILPIGLGCLVGYLGLRKALAFFRRILSGA